MWILVLIGTLACSGTRVAPLETSMPAHEDIVAAVANDPELRNWVATPQDYIVKQATVPGVENHTLWRIIPGDVPHPMSVFVAVPRSGPPILTSGSAPGVAAVIAAEPRLTALDAQVNAIFELLRDQSRRQTLAPAGTAGATPPQHRGNTYSFDVWDAGAKALERWEVTLSGPSSRFDRHDVGGAQ
jgi:hypothetical protein